MMQEHPDLDSLVDLEHALHWNGTRTLPHLAGCTACLATLRELEAVHDFVPEAEVEDVFLRDLQQTLRRVEPTKDPARLFLFPIAAAATWLALSFSSAVLNAAGERASYSPAAAVMMAVLVAVMLTWKEARRIAPAMALALMAGACAAHRPLDNTLLTELASEDQAYRTGADVSRTDRDRVLLVLEQIGYGRVATPADRTRAALILQHSPLTVRDGRLVALSPENFLLAHHLAKNAYESGYEPARALVPATMDRYLSLTAGYQKYGTNRFNDLETGVEELPYIDRNTTDQERARFGVKPLSELLKQFPERPRPTGSLWPDRTE